MVLNTGEWHETVFQLLIWGSGMHIGENLKTYAVGEKSIKHTDLSKSTATVLSNYFTTCFSVYIPTVHTANWGMYFSNDCVYYTTLLC